MVYTSGDGDAVRVEAVTGFSCSGLSFVRAPFTPEALKETAKRARNSRKGQEGSGAAVLFTSQRMRASPVLIREGKVERELLWPLYKGEGTPFPPTAWASSSRREAMTGLGAMKDGSPALLWAEGKSDEGNTIGVTLEEFAAAAKDLGLWNLIILDEGDYAGIAHYGKRKLRMAGAEQPVPSVIAIRG